MTLSELKKFVDGLKQNDIQPALFLGHGSPMNAIEDNIFTQSLNSLGQELAKPKAVLVVSAHWLTRGSFVSTALHPETIYDFGGFPPALYKVKYPAPGAPDEAHMVANTILTEHITEDPSMGLDHGAWSVIKHIWPEADVPVFQLSINWGKSPQWHYELAQELKQLRNKGIMILTSGNITHNLRNVIWDNRDASPVDWALEFDEAVRKAVESRNDQKIIGYETLASSARMAVPTNDHYLPLLYTLGASDKNEPYGWTFEGFQYGTVSMRCLRIG